MRAQSSFDVASLYPRYDRRLRRVVAAHVEVPESVVEDACQVAWTALLADAPPLEESQVFGWLATTARREALRMLRRSAIELRVIEGELGAPGAGVDPESPQAAAEFSDRLGQIRRLPPRQQRIVWMRGLGYRYKEIASETGETVRTIERQLTVARRRLDSAA